MPNTIVYFDDNRVPLREKVEVLSTSEAYPDKVPRVERIETHMSWVFLTPQYAYKLKKPARSSFLDFSTAEARRRDSEEEVRLNRRLAGDVYLGVVPLCLTRSGALRVEVGQEPVDWLVKMRRLPADCMLDNAIAKGQVKHNVLSRAADHLACFYREAAPVALEPAEYRHRFERDIEAQRAELVRPEFDLPSARIHAVCDRQLEYIDEVPLRFYRRVQEGRVIEGHGDLRPEHVCLAPEPVVIDCLEFNRDFRTLDAVDELAYLALECERLGALEVGAYFMQRYVEVTGDEPMETLINFYMSFRAMLRAKIAIWHTEDHLVQDVGKWSRRAAEYIDLGERHAAALI